MRKKERQKLSKKRRSIWRNKFAFLWFLLPSLAGVVLFVLCPFLDVVRRSFLTAVTEEWTGLRNYQIVFANQAFLLAVKNTVRFTLVCLPLLIADQVPVLISAGHAGGDGGADLENAVFQAGFLKRLADRPGSPGRGTVL